MLPGSTHEASSPRARAASIAWRGNGNVRKEPHRNTRYGAGEWRSIWNVKRIECAHAELLRRILPLTLGAGDVQQIGATPLPVLGAPGSGATSRPDHLP
jgi:hypothetical protein